MAIHVSCNALIFLSMVWELVADLLNPFFLEFLGALEHLGRGIYMLVIYVGQLSPAWGIRGHALSQFLQI